MEYPQLAVMNISHRYFDLEEFFSSAAASGYTCCELWTGAMHLYVDCHGYDSLEQVRELSQRYGVRIVGLCPEQNNPKPWNIAARGNEARARTLAYFKNVVDIAAELGAEQVMVSSGWAFLNEPIEDAWGRSASMLRAIAEHAGERGVRLVLEALKERGLMRRNAPHLVKDQSFVIPCYRWWEAPFYGIGLTLYDLMAGRLSFGRSRYLSRKRALEAVPTLAADKLKGGILYHDGQFDDSRMAVNLAQTAVEHGAVAVNYVRVEKLLKTDGRLSGVEAIDLESGRRFRLEAKAVVNATGVFVDSILQMDDPTGIHLVRPSQGVHLVLDRKFLRSEQAVMIPKTDDGRVLFAVPWHSYVVVGTTDTTVERPSLEPRPLEEEIDFILRTADRYLSGRPRREDVLSVFAGLRPLAAPKSSGESTKEISRSHKIMVSGSNLITIIGGKWTTYRRMAQDTVDRAISLGLVAGARCVTENLRIHGYRETTDFDHYLYVYGSDLEKVETLIRSSEENGRQLHPRFGFRAGQVVWAVREEMALHVEDVLSRRIRALFRDARAAREMARPVAEIMARELGRPKDWIESETRRFQSLCDGYMLQRERI